MSQRRSAFAQTRSHDRLIRGLTSIGRLTPTEEIAIRALPMRLATFDAHQNILQEGDKLVESCLVVEGILCRHKVIGAGARQILSFHLPGDVPDLQGMCLSVSDYALEALGPSQVAMIPHQAIVELMRDQPNLMTLLWRYTLIDAAIFRAWLGSVGRRTAYQRVAHLFCEIYTRMKARGLADGTSFVFPVTQNELADALGLSTVHINRTLQELRRDGVIISRGKHHSFTDWERLKRAGDFDATYLHIRGDL